MTQSTPTPSPSHTVSAVDVLISGDVLRIVLDGTPKLRARNALEALQELRAEHEDFRSFVIDPPRGHPGVDACLLLPPFSPDAIRTAIIAEHFGYAPVAGTPLLASAAALIETGQVSVREPETRLVFDTAQGKTEVIASIKDGRCLALRWITVRPRIIAHNQGFTLEARRVVPASVISPGLPYLVARAADMGVSLADAEALGAAGAMLSRAAGEQLPLRQVEMEQDLDAYLVMVADDLFDRGQGEAAQVQAAFVSPTGEIARMPTATGTLSVAAHFIDKGQLAAGQFLQVTSPTGHSLTGRIDATRASVEGSARVVSLLQLVADPLDERASPSM